MNRRIVASSLVMNNNRTGVLFRQRPRHHIIVAGVHPGQARAQTARELYGKQNIKAIDKKNKSAPVRLWRSAGGSGQKIAKTTNEIIQVSAV